MAVCSPLRTRLESYFANVKAIMKQVGERALVNGMPPTLFRLKPAHLGDDPRLRRSAISRLRVPSLR
jgi:hypothetical protein